MVFTRNNIFTFCLFVCLGGIVVSEGTEYENGFIGLGLLLTGVEIAWAAALRRNYFGHQVSAVFIYFGLYFSFGEGIGIIQKVAISLMLSGAISILSVMLEGSSKA